MQNKSRLSQRFIIEDASLFFFFFFFFSFSSFLLFSLFFLLGHDHTSIAKTRRILSTSPLDSPLSRPLFRFPKLYPAKLSERSWSLAPVARISATFSACVVRAPSCTSAREERRDRRERHRRAIKPLFADLRRVTRYRYRDESIQPNDPRNGLENGFENSRITLFFSFFFPLPSLLEHRVSFETTGNLLNSSISTFDKRALVYPSLVCSAPSFLYTEFQLGFVKPLVQPV